MRSKHFQCLSENEESKKQEVILTYIENFENRTIVFDIKNSYDMKKSLSHRLVDAVGTERLFLLSLRILNESEEEIKAKLNRSNLFSRLFF